MASKPFLAAGRDVWYAKVKQGGRWVKVNLGRHPTPFPAGKPPKKPPQEVLDRLAALAAREQDEKLGLAKGEHDLRSYFEAYVDAYGKTHPQTSLGLVVRLGGLFLDFCRSRNVKTLEGVTRALCRDYMEHRAERVGPSTLRTEKGYVAPIFTRAVEDEILEVNPWANVKPPGKVARHVPTFWTSEEVGRIIAACREGWERDLVTVLANTGMRVSAALKLKLGWCREGAIYVPAVSDKGGKGYAIPINAPVREVLSRLASQGKRKDEYLFASTQRPGKPYSYAAAQKGLYRALKESGVKPGTIHDLRHTFARHLSETAPIHVVRAVLGHSSLAMTQRYTDVSDSSVTSRHMNGFRLGSSPGESDAAPPQPGPDRSCDVGPVSVTPGSPEPMKPCAEDETRREPGGRPAERAVTHRPRPDAAPRTAMRAEGSRRTSRKEPESTPRPPLSHGSPGEGRRKPVKPDPAPARPPSAGPLESWVNHRKLAKLMDVTPRDVRRWVQNRTFPPPVHEQGVTLFWKRADVETFLSTGKWPLTMRRAYRHTPLGAGGPSPDREG